MLQEVIDMINITMYKEMMTEDVRHEKMMTEDVKHEKTIAEDNLQWFDWVI